MRASAVILGICALGFAATHWNELRAGHLVPSSGSPRLILYGKKSCAPWIQAQAELRRQNIPFEKADLDDDGVVSELTDKCARIGKVTAPKLPVADLDGVLMENATAQKIVRRWRGLPVGK